MMPDGHFNDDWIYPYQTGVPKRATTYPASPNECDNIANNSRYGSLRTSESHRPVLSPAQALQAVLQEQSLSSNPETSLGKSYQSKTSIPFTSNIPSDKQPIFVTSEIRHKLPANNYRTSLTPTEQKQLIQKLQQQQQQQQRLYPPKYNRQSDQFTLAPQLHHMQPRIRQATMDRKSSATPPYARASRLAEEQQQQMMPPGCNRSNASFILDNRTARINDSAKPTDASSTETINKFRNFLATLLRLAHKDDTSGPENPVKVNTLHQLICSLLEGSITTETFTRNLQQHFSSPNQPQLTPFLQRALPLVRQMYSTSQFMSIVVRYAKELIIKGNAAQQSINRQMGTSSMGPSVVSTSRVSNVNKRPLHVTLPVEIKTNGGSLWLRPNPQRQAVSSSSNSLGPPVSSTPSSLHNIGQLVNITGLSLSNRQRLSNSLASLIPSAAVKTEAAEHRTDDIEQLRLIQRQLLTDGADRLANVEFSSARVVDSPISHLDSTVGHSTAEPDDDLNDVTVMAGVNLLEEIKSCYQQSDDACRRLAELEEPGFFNVEELHKVCEEICEQEDLQAPDIEFSRFLSDFAEDFCRTIVRKCVDSARLRQQGLGKDNPDFTVVNETKRQLKFLEAIKRSEHQRRDALERERLMKAAKSRSKLDDPESEKLKLQAKELEKQEIEERRQQEANETALAAIGRKRKKTNNTTPLDAVSNSTQIGRQTQVKRNVRITLSDLLRVLEPMEFPNKTVLMTYAHEGMFTFKPSH